MGNGACYVLVEAGTVRLEGDHRGGSRAPAEVLSCPEGTAAYLRSLEPADRLLDTVSAEGAILLDGDQQVLLRAGRPGFGTDPHKRVNLSFRH